jgi:hypothetical protein
VANRVATPLSPAKADRNPRDPAARQVLGSLNDADTTARRGSEKPSLAPPSAWQQVPYASKKSKNRRRSTSRSSSAARGANEAHGDDPGGLAGRAARSVVSSDAWAEAVDRRAWANARVMGLPQAAASRANSRIKGLLSEEERDGRHGG